MKTVIHSLSRGIETGAGVPEWVHLIPVSGFRGVDGRGPYLVDAKAIVDLFNREGRKLPIDENHSIDILAARGGSTPARGWIVELEARDDGIWGKVEWTDEGRRLIEGKAYGFLSPALMVTKTKPHTVSRLMAAALTNGPNLTTLKSLHNPEEIGMDEELREALGLPADASNEDVLAAVRSAHAASTSHPALMARIAEAAGADKDLSGDELIAAVAARGKDAGESEDLRKELNTLQKRLTDVVSTHAKERAVVVIEAAIEAGKLVPALRDHYIVRHTKNPAEVETEIKALPSIHAGGLGGRKDPPAKGELGASDQEVCQLMGIDPEKYAETLKAEQKEAH